MKQMRVTRVLLLGALVVVYASCSSSPKVQEFPDTANPTAELRVLNQEMKVAADAGADVLSPTNFEEAKEHSKEAKKIIERQGKSKDALHHVAEGKAYLKLANQFAAVSERNLREVVSARQQALAAGAKNMFKDDFKELDEDLVDVTEDIEKNKFSSTKSESSKLQLAYLDLELRAIKQASLGRSLTTISKAHKEGAPEFAPRSLAIARKSVSDTAAYITANRHNVEEIQARAQDAQEKSDHLLKITRESRISKRTSSEERALALEAERNTVRDQRGELARGAVVAQGLAASNQDLLAKESLNKRYDEARRQFASSEADVFKQGDALLIRLKGLKFPSAGSELKRANYPLMVKVQNVLKSFGAGSVVVQGHTDSVGGKKLNEDLSRNRAESVKDYLTTNSADQFMTIEAEGWGYRKPIATNKTANGRAYNRRVDLVITPDQESEIAR